jgi:hypothetical protein
MTQTKSPFLSDAWYDRLKWIAQILLPAVGALYFALAGTLDLPAPDKVVGTIVAVDAFLGALLGLSTMQYNKAPIPYDGTLVVAQNDNSLIHQLEIDTPPEEMRDKAAVIFQVRQGPPAAPVPLKE